MYAIVQLGSQQYKISEGDIIEAQKIQAEKGKTVVLDPVLMYVHDETVKIGQPYLKDVKVTAEVMNQTKGEKVISFKHWRRKNKSWKKGHRQKLTALSIVKIDAKT